MESQSTPRRNRNQSQELHQFLTQTVGCEEGDPLYLALSFAGLSMRLMIQMLRGPGKPPDTPYHSAEYLRQLKFKDPEGRDIELSPDQWTQLVAVGPYISWAQCNHGPYGDREELKVVGTAGGVTLLQRLQH